MCDAPVESAEDHRARDVERVDAPEIVPQAEGQRWKLQPAPAAMPIGHPLVTVRRRRVHQESSRDTGMRGKQRNTKLLFMIALL